MMTTDTVGGVWGYTLQLARGLAQYGVTVTLVSVGRAPNGEQRAAMFALPNLHQHYNLPYKLEWMPGNLADILAARGELAALLERLNPDILHSNQFCFGDLPTACPRLVVAHSDIIGWQRWCGDADNPPDEAWQRFMADYHRLVQCGLYGASSIVAPSQFIADGLCQDYALAKSRINVIYNGLSIQPYLGVKERLALTVGRLWDKAKNIAMVVEAVQQGRNDGLPLRVVIAGEDEKYGHKGIASKSSGIEYLGLLSTGPLYRQYAHASVYIAASRYEPFGLAVVEAALHGCAILANDIPTFHELWGDDAVYFSRNSAASLRENLADLLNDGTKAASYGARAHLRALNRYNAERMAGEYVELYQKLLPTPMWYNRGTNLHPNIDPTIGV